MDQQSSKPQYKYLFGPVPSRRFGLSLGLDLLTPKTCTYNCLFCEVGRTTVLTLERREYVPCAGVLAEFDSWLAAGGKADFVTVAGAGEPTLHTGFGTILREVKKRCNFRTALLTNGSLLHLPDVRRDACQADVVKVSLSAWDEQSYRKINKPDGGLSFDDLVRGITAFRGEFAGKLWLEVFIMAGFNDDGQSIRRIAGIAQKFHPDVVHLNTVARPPADRSAAAVSQERLQSFAGCFTPSAVVIAGFASGIRCEVPAGESDVVAMLARRPCTVKDIAASFSMPESSAAELVRKMIADGRLTVEMRGTQEYYLPAAQAK